MFLHRKRLQFPIRVDNPDPGGKGVAVAGRSAAGSGASSEGIVSRLVDGVRHVVEDLMGGRGL